MADKKIFLSSPHMSDEGYEQEFIREAFDTNWIAPLGPNVDAFEEEFTAKTGSHFAAALSSGTAALHMALKSAGVGPGNTVFCSSLTFSASANPIIYQGATPVFIDCDYGTWNMSAGFLEEAFKKYRPKAVIAVHLYGLSADMDSITRLCGKHDTVLIEDAAESLGTLYKDKQTGTIGDYGIFSFNSNKIITTSGGGMLVSKDREAVEKVRFWATQSRDKARHYQHSELGYNYRMSNVLAGIGRDQLKVMDKRIQRKRQIFEFYRNAFHEIEQIEMMPVNRWNEPNFWLTCITLKKSRIKPVDIIEALERENIEARHIWKPMHLQPFFKGYEFVGSGISEDIFNRGVCLPSDTKMTDEDLSRITTIVKQSLNHR